MCLGEVASGITSGCYSNSVFIATFRLQSEKNQTPSQMCVSYLDKTLGARGAEGHVRKHHIENTILDEMYLISKELQSVTLKMDEQSST